VSAPRAQAADPQPSAPRVSPPAPRPAAAPKAPDPSAGTVPPPAPSSTAAPSAPAPRGAAPQAPAAPLATPRAEALPPRVPPPAPPAARAEAARRVETPAALPPRVAAQPASGAGNPLARLAALRAQGSAAPALAAAAPLPAGNARVTGQKPAPRSPASPEDERARMTVFGARNAAPVGGKPRFLGLMLTAALLVFLAGVAAWASVFLDEGLARLFRSPAPSTEIAALPETAPEPAAPVTEPAAPAAAPEAGEERLAALDPRPVPAPEASDAPGAEPQARPAPAPASPALSQPETPRALSPEEAAATYAATGIWQRAPAPPMTPPAEGVEDVYVASLDPAVQSSDAVALPTALSPADEPALREPGLPPPPGMTFDIDDRGLVRATPEGALTPEGLRVFAGLPPVVPPLRSPAEAPEAPAAPETAAPEQPEEGQPEADQPAFAAPAPAEPAPAVLARLEPFRDLRPQARPDDVIEQRERATLQGITRSELAALRPVMRPLSPQEEAEAAAPDSPATAQAVAVSLAPVRRPGDMAAIVRRAEPAPAQTAAVAPRSVTPDVPSSASVARSATVRNAINLGRINLIGVYGTPSNRRALVRLSNGKYQKVQVGDRLDGGRVAGIGDAELRYTKGSRTVTLEMPGG
jgi:hypothetical protein